MHLRPNQEDYPSFLHVFTFSNLIVSTLSQNPAAHAAASFAATFWSYTNVQSSSDSPTCDQGGFPSRQMNSATSMAAITAVTVAAATAWWASHGLLSVCAPLHAGCKCAPAFVATVPPMENVQAPAAKMDGNISDDQDQSMQDQQLDHEYSEAMQGQHSTSKSPTSSSDCEESRDAKVNTEVKAAEVTEPQDANKTKNKKQVDRSSSGSNTPYQADWLFKPSSPYKYCHSFSPPHDAKNKEQQKKNVARQGDLADHREVEYNALSKAKNIVEESLLTIELGYEKLKGSRTGFKPYKVDEKDPKRIRLEGEAST
ncbi:Homeodomain-like superfamily protein isoform 1 [Hibiscus syriacus]|uniref:Homeodomain-like superfamily protein isoform 1 n=1 Tax=Hibiscus syriacus TaxID=106335 RepID=A0A6A3C0C2_HIBSY|nr:Homeodomain-like superfamily protein isoform 1 [Hibiscus syriacus]